MARGFLFWFPSVVRWVEMCERSENRKEVVKWRKMLSFVVFRGGKKNASESGTKVAGKEKWVKPLVFCCHFHFQSTFLSFFFYCCCVQPHSRNDPLDQPGGSLSLVGRAMEELPIKLGTHNILQKLVRTRAWLEHRPTGPCRQVHCHKKWDTAF